MVFLEAALIDLRNFYIKYISQLDVVSSLPSGIKIIESTGPPLTGIVFIQV
jgi:hypothetical protein